MHRHLCKLAMLLITASALLSPTLYADTTPTSSMIKIGEGKLRYLFWDVYTAALYAETAIFSFDRPYALKITYARSLSKDQLIQSTKEELNKQALAQEQKIAQWGKALGDLWQDVEKGDQLTLWVDNKQVAHFVLNNTVQGNINDPEFATAFIAIWLGENTSKPELRAKLLNL